MQRSSLAMRAGLILALVVLGAGYFIFGSPGTSSAPDADRSAMSATVFETFAMESREADFPALSEPWELSLPEDHGGHDDARSEIWTMVAHLENGSGDPLGLQVSLARLGLLPPSAASEASPLAMAALYRAHVVLADPAADRVLAEERLSRGIGAAGHDGSAGEIWLDDWLVAYGEGETGQGVMLDLSAEGVPISLKLAPLKPADRTSGTEGLRGFAIPRLAVEGRVGETAVAGTAVLNHAWGDVPLPGGATANDVLAVQLDDGSDLFLVRTTRRDGRGGAVLDGLISGPDAASRAVANAGFEMTPATSEGAVIDREWRIEGPDLVLEAIPLVTGRHDDFAFAFSSGFLRVTGTRSGEAVAGLGSLQRIGGGR